MININILDKYSYNDIYPNVTCGIYAIYEDNNIIYIGSSRNIYLRLKSHISYIRMKQNNGCLTYNRPLYKYLRNTNKNIYVKVLKNIPVNISTHSLRLIEKYYIIKYKPICNKSLPY